MERGRRGLRFCGYSWTQRDDIVMIWGWHKPLLAPNDTSLCAGNSNQPILIYINSFQQSGTGGQRKPFYSWGNLDSGHERYRIWGCHAVESSRRVHTVRRNVLPPSSGKKNNNTHIYTQPHIKKPTHTHTPTHYKIHTLQNPHTHPHTTKPTHTHTHR